MLDFPFIRPINPISLKSNTLCFYYCLSVFFFLGMSECWAQVESDERPLLMSKNGIGFQKDSVFLMNLRFRMQNRAGYYSQLDNIDEPGTEALVRRLRLRFDGYILNPRLSYYIQLSFSRNDQDLVTESVPQTIRDAMVYYTFNENFYMGFGQSKLPGNRQRVVSSGNLQMPDRSIANNTFTLDRDMGFFLYGNIPLGEKQFLKTKFALSSGEGRGQLQGNTGLSYTGRVEWLPLGKFQNSGDYSEGDLEFEKKPRLAMGVAYNFNNRTTQSGGQIGFELPAPVDLQTFIADAAFKYSGWSLSAEYFNRKTSGISEANVNQLIFQRIPQGQGLNVQGSRMIGRKQELVVRYATITPPQTFKAYQLQRRTKALGYNYYLYKHRVKLQAYLGLDDRLHPETVPALPFQFKNRFHGMIQMELGI